VALSGGGHRATLFGLGALLYLARAQQNRRVSQITSVSGGSITNGFVAQTVNFQTCTTAEFDRVAGKLAAQVADRGTLFAIWQTKAYLVVLGATGLAAVVAIVTLIWRPTTLPDSWLVWVLPFGFVTLFGWVLQLRGRLCAHALERTLFSRDGKSTSLAQLPGPPFHVICATEIQTGNGAYFLRAPFKVTYDKGTNFEYFPCVRCAGFQTTIRDFPLATAVQASAALPFAFPSVKLDVKGWRGITRRKRHQAWINRSANNMVLADGGVRDNLGVEWLESNAHISQLIVVSGAANRVHATPRSTSVPLIGELISLLLVKDLPYNTREQNRRADLLRRFLPRYSGATTDVSGAVLHIDESPYDLPEALMRSKPAEPIDEWLNTPEDQLVANALRLNPSFAAFFSRAQAARQKLEQSEDVEHLRAVKLAAASRKKQSGVSLELIKRSPAAVLVAETWDQRAFSNANVSTNLSMLGRDTAAELIRHSYALAMTKLHILFDYPLCDIPSVGEICELMDQSYE
jgi:predicted acylesterase/phospholipase RssA